MKRAEIIETIRSGQTSLGIEFGSTRIKSVLIDAKASVLATGSFTWENRNEDGLWIYYLEDAIYGLQQSYADLAKYVQEEYGVELVRIGAIGISGMMHGFLVLDKQGNQLAPFLTWRNTNTEKAAEELTQLFDFNIPLRWSIAQLYQAILEKKKFVEKIDYMTTLAGYIHWLLSGERVLGVGDASGMFPIDSSVCNYDSCKLQAFEQLVSGRKYPWQISGILPKVLAAGDNAGMLTEEGAKLLDVSGRLHAGILMAPPEGDAATGMTATNSVAVRTGNISAGTSIFSMVVLEKPLSRLYGKIDMVTTPNGRPVAMVHCNNGTSELDAWYRIFKEFAEAVGIEVTPELIYQAMFEKSLEGSPDCKKVFCYNFLAGEPMVDLMEGCPLLVRTQDSEFSFANFMRSQIYSVVASLAIGMRILDEEQVKIERLTGHGGLFKTSRAGQKFMAAAMKAPVTVMSTAGEGGPYGMALLASYMQNRSSEESLEQFLAETVFSECESNTINPDAQDIEGFTRYIEQYKKGLLLEETAVKCMK